MESDAAARRAAIAGLGKELTPALIAGTSRMFEPLLPPVGADLAAVEDQAYGPHARQRIDVFAPKDGAASRPMLLFAGGGSLMTALNTPGHKLRTHVAAWAARQGTVGAAMTFRIAPENQWPAGADDVARAVDWLRANAARFGGDPDRIFVMGHSAGAGHVGGYIGRTAHKGCVGAILVSGLYNVLTLPGGPNKAYFGSDPQRYPEMVVVDGLVRSDTPLLVAVSEFDPPNFEAQAAELLLAAHARRAQLPRFVRLTGHNHVSIAQHIGALDSPLTAEILDFVRTGR